MSYLLQSREHVRAALEEEGIPEAKADALARLLLPCVRPEVDVAAKIERRGSKMGGNPDLPAEFVWPTLRGIPLGYLVQINLEEIAHFESASELPSHGMLTFFFGIGPADYGSYETEPGSWAVVWSPDLARCVPREAPIASLYPEHRFTFSEGVFLPTYECLSVEELALNDGERTAYREVRHSLLGPQMFELLGHALGGQGAVDSLVHAAATGIEPQWEDPDEAKAIGAAAREAGWRQLFGLPYNDAMGYVYGHSGMLNFWIRDEDLRSRNFQKAWLDLEAW